MRIAYVCHWNLDADDGVARKIVTQAGRWRAEGHEVEVVAVSPGAPAPRPHVTAFPYTDARSRLRATAAAVGATRRVRPDVVYLRYDTFLPPAWALPRLLPTVIEVNSDTGAAMRAEWASDLALRYNLVNRRIVLAGAAGFVAVSGELAGDRQLTRWNRPTLVVANGIDVAAVPALPAPANERPRALFLGSPRQPWHGVDKLVELARALPELDVDVVGYTAADSRLIRPPLPPNVRLHGYLSREEYAPLAARADLAFGSLALHRAQLREGGPLKVREYLAAGLPVVIGYEDTDLAGIEAPWLLRLPNEEDNVARSVDAVRAFAHRVRGLRVPRDEIAPLIDAGAKERRRLAFLEEVAA